MFLNLDVQYFPKNEKYVPLFVGSDDSEIVDKRNGLRKQIEDRLTAAAASGKDLEGSLPLISLSISSFFEFRNRMRFLLLLLLVSLVLAV